VILPDMLIVYAVLEFYRLYGIRERECGKLFLASGRSGNIDSAGLRAKTIVHFALSLGTIKIQFYQ
jgi:hypothetical protein